MSLKPLVFSMAIGCLAMAADIDAGEDPGAKLSAPAESDQVARVAAIERLELDAPIRSNVIATYKDGFILETIGEGETPFQLKVNGRMQGRYTGFSGSGSSQTPRDHFEIERGRIEFRGHMYDPKLQFFYNLDADTDDNHDVKFHDFWINYNFADAFRLYFGKQKVASGEI